MKPIVKIAKQLGQMCHAVREEMAGTEIEIQQVQRPTEGPGNLGSHNHPHTVKPQTLRLKWKGGCWNGV